MTTIKNPSNEQIALELCRQNPNSKYAQLLKFDGKSIDKNNLSLFAGEPEIANEFISNMANKIVVQHTYDLFRDYDNRVSVFMKPMSKLGDAEEMLSAELATAEDYVEGTDPFTDAEKPTIILSWIKTEDKKKSRVKLTYDIWAGAFVNEGALSNLAGIILKNLRDTIELYIQEKVNADLVDPLKITKSSTIASVTDAGDVVNAQKAYEQIIKLKNDMSLPSTNYNTAGMKTFTPINRGILVLNSTYRSSFDVNVLASLFHADKVGENKYFSKIIMLPLDPSTVGVVLDDEAYIWGYRFTTAQSITNPSDLTICTYYHAWIKRAFVPFRQAVRLVNA